MIFSGLQPWASGGHAWRQAQPAQAAALASKAKQPRPTPVVFRPSSYPGALLTPSGEIDLDAAVGRRHLVEEFGLKPRDIAAMFSKNARRGFGLNVRRGGALLSLGRDGPSVVVANTTAWILLRDSRDKSLADVGAKIQQKFVDLAASVREQHTAEEPGHTAEEPRHIAEEPGREPVPFALAVTEALLTIYLDKISGELEEAVEKADLLIRDYTAMRQDQAGNPQLEKLRITKQRLDAVQSQAKSFQTVLLQALEDEDDLSDLAKSVGPTKEEWELCFEYYSQSAAEVDAEVSAHVEAMDDLENFWLLRLSARRLELEKSQLWLEVLGVGLNVGAVITGIFGMNITSGLETRRPIFFARACMAIVAFSCVVSIGLKMLVSRRLRNQGVAMMPNLLSGREPPERQRFRRAARSF